ncbi:MAG: hypothetical protein ACI8YQ_000168 [Polaribacter sp.]|jgi:hypothetical protein
MSDSQNRKDELKEFAPDLLRMEKREGYEVPPRYFDRLGEEVIHRMRMEEETTKEKNISWLTTLGTALQNTFQPRYAMGMAAVVLLLIGIQQFGPGTTNEEANLTFASLTDAEFDSYLSDNILDFEDELLDELAADMSFIPENIGDEELDIFFKERGGLKDLEELLL